MRRVGQQVDPRADPEADRPVDQDTVLATVRREATYDNRFIITALLKIDKLVIRLSEKAFSLPLYMPKIGLGSTFIRSYRFCVFSDTKKVHTFSHIHL